MFVPIPTDAADGTERIRRAHQAMDAAKAHLNGAPVNPLADLTRVLPPMVLARAAHLVTAVAALPGLAPAVNVNISNVPGPRRPLGCAGATVESIVPLAGISDGMGLNITVMSYQDRMEVGVVADAELVPQPQQIVDWMAHELAELTAAAAARDVA